MRKTLIYPTAILSSLAFATAAMADTHSQPKSDTMKPPAEQTQAQDNANPSSGTSQMKDGAKSDASTSAQSNTSADPDLVYISFTRFGKFDGSIAGGYTAAELIGTDLVGPTGDTVGEIADLLIDSNNEVNHVLVDVGGFLGIGEKRVALDLAELERDGDKIRTSMTEEQLEAQVAFKEQDDKWLASDENKERSSQ